MKTASNGSKWWQGMARLFEKKKPTLPEPQETEKSKAAPISELVRHDVMSFSQELPNIPGLTPDLYFKFMRGFISDKRPNGRYFLQEMSLEGTMMPSGVEISEAEHLALKQLRAAMPKIPSSEGDSEAVGQLIQYAKGRGIRITVARKNVLEPWQAKYIQTVLEMLPDSFFDRLYLQEVRLGDRSEELMYDQFAAYDYREGIVYLDSLIFNHRITLTRNVLGLLVHEMGHAVAARYNKDASLLKAFEAIRGKGSPPWIGPGNKIYTIDWFDGRYSRLRHTSKNFDEFVAEHCLIFLVDNPGLRRHIEQLQSDPATRHQGEAYEFFYCFLSGHIFSVADVPVRFVDPEKN